MERIEFKHKSGLLTYTAITILEEDDTFVTFIDRYNLKQTLRKDLIIRRWEVRE